MTRKENWLDQRTAALLKAIDKQIAAIRAGIDPQVARALEKLLAAGLIVQDGERPNDTGKMLPAYKINPNVDRSKWDEILDALDADPQSGMEGPTIP